MTVSESHSENVFQIPFSFFEADFKNAILQKTTKNIGWPKCAKLNKPDC